MYNIFINRNNINYGLIKLPYFDFIKRAYLEEINKTNLYYRDSIKRVKSNHLLARMLNNISVPVTYEAEQYVNAINTRILYIANELKMTTETSHGQIFKDIFYGEGSQEIIMLTTEYFNPKEAERTWKTLSPVRVLLHPKTDLKLVPPLGINSTDEKGLVVIAINIALLALQYRCYVLSINQKKTSDFSSITYFLYRYPIPNMLRSQTDIALFNRYINLYNNKAMGTIINRNPFLIHDYEAKIDNVLLAYLKLMPTKKVRYEQFLESFPAIGHNDMLQSLQMPNLAKTRQIWWALHLSRLDIIKTIIMSLGVKSIIMNRSEINILQRDLLRLDKDNIFKQMLPLELYTNTKNIIDFLLSI